MITDAAEQSHTKIRIVAAESFELVRMGLRTLLENDPSIKLVAETGCVEDLFSMTMQHKPDVILIDLHLNDGNCAEPITKLLATCPKSKVLALSDQNSEYTYLEAFRSGAAGIVSKHQSSELILKAIHSIHNGQLWFDRRLTKLIWQAQFGSIQELDLDSQLENQASQSVKLRDSERQVAYLACRGLSAKEISTLLLVTEKTIRNQLSVIYKKIGVKKQIELCLKAPLYNYFKDSSMIGIFYSDDSEK